MTAIEIIKYINSIRHCSDETTAVNHSGMITQITECDAYSWRRPRSESSADAESMYMTNPVLSDSGFAQQSRRSSVSVFIFSRFNCNFLQLIWDFLDIICALF